MLDRLQILEDKYEELNQKMVDPDVLNNPPDMAHARIYSRILEMCVPIHVTGVQNRKAAAQRKMDTLKSMMNEMVSND